MVTNEQIETIQKVADRVCHKYVFGYFDIDDIKQEAVMIGIKAVQEDWDGIRPLENFLAVVIPNRLKNFKRKNYFRLDVSEDNAKRTQSNTTKKKLMEVTELFDFDLVTENNVLETMSYNEIMEKLLKDMPPHIKADFNRLLNDVKISTLRRDQVCSYIREILNEDR